MNRLVVGSPDKTNLLLQLLAGDLPGVVVIDPTGDFAETAVASIPRHLSQNIFYFEPADMTHPASFNVLGGLDPDEHHRLVENICAYFEAMWPNGWGAQSNYILANCLRILLATPHTNLLGVLKLLTDKTYRTYCLSYTDDPVVLANWRHINGWDERQYQAAIAPLQNKIGTLLMSPIIRNVVGQNHSTFSLTAEKVVIANLSRQKLGDLTSLLLGGLLIARAAGNILISDLGFFATDRLPSILRQGNFTVACRSLYELTPKLRSVVLAFDHVYVMKTNYRDAEQLAFHVNLMNPRPLTELNPNEVRTSGGILEPPLPVPSQRLSAIRKRSRACHTRPRAQVETAIARFFNDQPTARPRQSD